MLLCSPQLVGIGCSILFVLVSWDSLLFLRLVRPSDMNTHHFFLCVHCSYLTDIYKCVDERNKVTKFIVYTSVVNILLRAHRLYQTWLCNFMLKVLNVSENGARFLLYMICMLHIDSHTAGFEPRNITRYGHRSTYFYYLTRENCEPEICYTCSISKIELTQIVSKRFQLSPLWPINSKQSLRTR